MSVSRSAASHGRSRLSIAVRGFLARICGSACRATDWLCGDGQTRLRSQNKEGQMESQAKEAKKESKALVFIEVTGVIVAYIAIIASLAYPVVTATSWGG